ncbi:MAG: rRNA maturation RNase YbeY [Polyangiaceae bacterium]|nr:rRNA maturation RNase YbeY [Polyangiaceae bacterium]
MPVAVEMEEALALDGQLVARLTQAAERMLDCLEVADAELSLLLVGDETMRSLNLAHRNLDEPTDVLAFPMDFADDTGEVAAAPEAERLLGDVVISVPTATRQASAAGHPLLDEAVFLLAHGVLHLIGYDHGTDTEKVEMDRETARLLATATPIP